ncbi:energy-coupling factor transporter ATPase [uncultured Limosilactobacillus sp.]|uniref:energy-coupling factor transporter ATPase n=1 Tax=uncultured Limosilactobacillus sp. TaxID=2837629 RepID=UPI0025F18768|nr:energy-coupling factor transporter ATPase [uncultured Limosilactobacillus sp.]
MALFTVNLKNVSFTYQAGTPFAHQALFDLSLRIKRGSYTAVVGHTGSGKSTIMQLIDGLLRPTEGTVTVNGATVTPSSSRRQLAALRSTTGFVFQLPEKQLFAETVIEDVMFGPLNNGQSPTEARQNARQALQAVGLGEEFDQQSPFDLSGGQMRRVAIAGVLAMKPLLLILDEPTAGLDSQGAMQMLELVDHLHRQGTTILLVTHQMEQVAAYADQVVVINHGRLAFQGEPRQLFTDKKLLAENALRWPTAVVFDHALRDGGVRLPGTVPLTIDELADKLAAQLKGRDQDE